MIVERFIKTLKEREGCILQHTLKTLKKKQEGGDR
jgi:hypothetical protein